MRRSVYHRSSARSSREGDMSVDLWLTAYQLDGVPLKREDLSPAILDASQHTLTRVNFITHTEIEINGFTWSNDTDLSLDNLNEVLQAVTGVDSLTLSNLVSVYALTSKYNGEQFDVLTYLVSLYTLWSTSRNLRGVDTERTALFSTTLDKTLSYSFPVGGTFNATYIVPSRCVPNDLTYDQLATNGVRTGDPEDLALAEFVCSLGYLNEDTQRAYGMRYGRSIRVGVPYFSDTISCRAAIAVDDGSIHKTVADFPALSASEQVHPQSILYGATRFFRPELIGTQKAYDVYFDAELTRLWKRADCYIIDGRDSDRKVYIGNVDTAAMAINSPGWDGKLDLALKLLVEVPYQGQDFYDDGVIAESDRFSTEAWTKDRGNVTLQAGKLANATYSTVRRPVSMVLPTTARVSDSTVQDEGQGTVAYAVDPFTLVSVSGNAKNVDWSLVGGTQPFFNLASAASIAGVASFFTPANSLSYLVEVPNGDTVLKDAHGLAKLVELIEKYRKDESYDVLMRALQLRRAKAAALEAFTSGYFLQPLQPVAQTDAWAQFSPPIGNVTKYTVVGSWIPNALSRDFIFDIPVDGAVQFMAYSSDVDADERHQFTITRRRDAVYIWVVNGDDPEVNIKMPLVTTKRKVCLHFDYEENEWFIGNINPATPLHSFTPHWRVGSAISDFKVRIAFQPGPASQCYVPIYDTPHGYPGWYSEDGLFIPAQAADAILERVNAEGISAEALLEYKELNDVYVSVLENVSALSANLTGDATTDGQYIAEFVNQMREQAMTLRLKASQVVYSLGDVTSGACYQASQHRVADQLELASEYVANVGSTVATQVQLGISPPDAILQTDLVTMRSAGDVDGNGAIALATGGVLSEFATSLATTFGLMIDGSKVVGKVAVAALVTGIRAAAAGLLAFNLAVQDAIGNLVSDGASITRNLTGDFAGYSSPIATQDIDIATLEGYSFLGGRSNLSGGCWSVRLSVPIDNAISAAHAGQHGAFRLCVISQLNSRTAKLMVYACRNVSSNTEAVLASNAAVPSDTLAATDITLSELAWLSLCKEWLAGSGLPFDSLSMSTKFDAVQRYSEAASYMNSKEYEIRVLAHSRASLLGTSALLFAGLGAAAAYLIPGVGLVAGSAIVAGTAAAGAIAGSASITQTYGDSGTSWREQALTNAQNNAFSAAELDQLAKYMRTDTNGIAPITVVNFQALSGDVDIQTAFSYAVALAIGGGLCRRLNLTATSSEAANVISLAEKLNGLGVLTSTEPSAMYTFLTQAEYMARVKKVAVGAAVIVASLTVAKLVLKRAHTVKKLQNLLTTGPRTNDDRTFLTRYKRLARKQWFGGSDVTPNSGAGAAMTVLDKMLLNAEESSNPNLLARINAIRDVIG